MYNCYNVEKTSQLNHFYSNGYLSCLDVSIEYIHTTADSFSFNYKGKTIAQIAVVILTTDSLLSASDYITMHAMRIKQA